MIKIKTAALEKKPKSKNTCKTMTTEQGGSQAEQSGDIVGRYRCLYYPCTAHFATTRALGGHSSKVHTGMSEKFNEKNRKR